MRSAIDRLLLCFDLTLRSGRREWDRSSWKYEKLNEEEWSNERHGRGSYCIIINFSFLLIFLVFLFGLWDATREKKGTAERGDGRGPVWSFCIRPDRLHDWHGTILKPVHGCGIIAWAEIGGGEYAIWHSPLCTAGYGKRGGFPKGHTIFYVQLEMRKKRNLDLHSQ